MEVQTDNRIQSVYAILSENALSLLSHFKPPASVMNPEIM